MRDELCKIEVEVEQTLSRRVNTKWLHDELSDSPYRAAYDAYKYEERTALDLMQAMAEQLKELRQFAGFNQTYIDTLVEEVSEWTEANFEVTDVDVEWPSY